MPSQLLVSALTIPFTLLAFPSEIPYLPPYDNRASDRPAFLYRADDGLD